MPSIDLLMACLIAYLFGSLSSAIIVCKLLGFADPRTQGSQNPGATNVLRLGGKKAALLTLLGDMLKGVIPVLAAKYYGFSYYDLSLVALSAFVGHLYPVFFRFQGGKGVATMLGVSLALYWPLGLLLVLTWVGIAITFRYSSLAALGMTICAPFFTWYLLGTDTAGVMAAMGVLLIIRHQQNIRKLISGNESRFGKK